MDIDGAVRAMVGGRDYSESQFNRATDAMRQPGSSFKPYVYATALMNGFKPTSIVVDSPVCIGNWCPRNYGGGFSCSRVRTGALKGPDKLGSRGPWRAVRAGTPRRAAPPLPHFAPESRARTPRPRPRPHTRAA